MWTRPLNLDNFTAKVKTFPWPLRIAFAIGLLVVLVSLGPLLVIGVTIILVKKMFSLTFQRKT